MTKLPEFTLDADEQWFFSQLNIDTTLFELILGRCRMSVYCKTPRANKPQNIVSVDCPLFKIADFEKMLLILACDAGRPGLRDALSGQCVRKSVRHPIAASDLQLPQLIPSH
ncbi:hypothetical protein N9267_01180 [bacterium]|nr:hypothetical protein [bacterium]